MIKIKNKLLLEDDRFLPEKHLQKSGFTYSTCVLFTKNYERIRKFKEPGDLRNIYQNELEKSCSQNDMAYGYF